jgi:CRP-like cAMP-binding protein
MRARARAHLLRRQGFDDQCLGCIASHLRPAAFVSGETVFQCGDRGDEMYLVVDGRAFLHTGLPLTGSESAAAPDPQEELADSHSEEEGAGLGPQELPGGGSEDDAGRKQTTRRAGRVVGKGDVFGEGGLFTQELGLFRRESAEAMSWLSVYVLTASALQEISAEYPEVPPFHHGLDGVG